jgi:predicted transcriptional regulator
LNSSNAQPLWDRRDRLHIMAEIMEITKGSQLKTRIMYGANLSFSQVNEYLSFLTEMGFLKVNEVNGQTFYETTTKGERYIQNYMEMSSLLRSEERAEAPMVI